jgi:hypothetical protein
MSLNKLTDAQLVLLSSATRHTAGAIELELPSALALARAAVKLREA